MTASGSQHPLAFFADIFFAGLAAVACIALYLVAIAVVCEALKWWRGRRRRPRLRDLMDDGDGQGGIPPLPRRTRPYSLGDLVINPELERWAAHRAREILAEHDRGQLP